jgi:hypothetical protein
MRRLFHVLRVTADTAGSVRQPADVWLVLQEA